MGLVGKEVTFTLQTEDGIVYTGRGLVTRIEIENEDIPIAIGWTRCRFILDWINKEDEHKQPEENQDTAEADTPLT